MLCAFAGPVRGTWEPCTQQSECTAETCWDDLNAIDDGNKASDYRYVCDGGVCRKMYYAGKSYGYLGPLTVCQRYSSASFEGDAVASGPSVTANSAGKMGGAKGMIVMMLIVIMMTSMLIF